MRFTASIPVFGMMLLIAVAGCSTTDPVLRTGEERYWTPSKEITMKTKLPVGFKKFSGNKFYNYEMNRWYSLGYCRLEDLEAAASRIKTYDDHKAELIAIAEQAVTEGRLKNAAFYYRAAEFLVRPDDPDKIPLYEKFIELFYKAFAGDSPERFAVPYGDGFLPGFRLAAEGRKKGTVLVHGGFDSFIEEFYCIPKILSENGYEVYAFEGPGQGGALRVYNLYSDHAWEKPVAALLDYFTLNDVTILGISMGGYWCLRAAAFEKRITKVIAFPPLYDWMESTNGFNKGLVNWMMKHEGLMRWSIGAKRKIPTMEHVINNTLFISGKTDVLDVVRWEMAMNKEFLHSELVTQDVLLLASEKDAFQPPVMYTKQQGALTNARSVTGRILTKAEEAENHCAIGNMGLAIDVMIQWLDRKSSEP